MQRKLQLTAGLLGLGLVLTACTTDAPTESADPTTAATQDTETETDDEGGDTDADGGTPEGEFFVRADYERELAQRDMTPEGDDATPWLQMIEPIEMVDTSEFASEGPHTLCFSNASISNPWRVTGWTTMQQQV
ncbi:MAG TPA: hypothetical protein VKZ83_09570, partial [Phototrophicaceae bacterium]|nr:hypothetical protein [Phototrophicaceae bacterium]